MYSSDYYDPYYEEPTRRPINWGVVGSTALGAGAGLVTPQLYRSVVDIGLGKVQAVKENEKRYQEDYTKSINKRRKQFAGKSKEAWENTRQSFGKMHPKDAALYQNREDLIKDNRGLVDKLKGNERKKIEASITKKEFEEKRKTLRNNIQDNKKQLSKSTKDIKTRITDNFKKVKKELGKEPVRLKDTKGAATWMGNKKYFLPVDQAQEIAKSNSVLNKLTDDWANIRGVGGSGRLGAAGRLIISPLVGAGLGMISGRALFEN